MFAYLLDAVVDPLAAAHATPYQYLTPKNLFIYPFSSISLFLKAAGLVIIPLLFMSFFQGFHLLKAASLLVLSALYQLYAVQVVATDSKTIPLEWTLALTLAGLILLIPMVFFLFTGVLSGAHTKLSGGEPSDADFFPDEEEEPSDNETVEDEEPKEKDEKNDEEKEKVSDDIDEDEEE